MSTSDRFYFWAPLVYQACLSQYIGQMPFSVHRAVVNRHSLLEVKETGFLDFLSQKALYNIY